MAMFRARETFKVSVDPGEPPVLIQSRRAYSDDDPIIKKVVARFPHYFDSDAPAKSR